MADAQPLASLQYVPGKLDDVIAFLKRTRSELRELRLVRVWPDRVAVYDVNGDCFQIVGVGYPDAEIVPILDAVNTSYKKESIHEPAPGPFKEFKTGRRYPWAHDRVM